MESHFSDNTAREAYVNRHDLGAIPEDLEGFHAFYEARRERLLLRLKELLGDTSAAPDTTAPMETGDVAAPTVQRPDDWTQQECRELIRDYFQMLDEELRGQPYSKADHNRSLQERIDRSRGAIEMKHCNVSAVLQQSGQAYIQGYQPRSHTQQLLAELVKSELVKSDPA